MNYCPLDEAWGGQFQEINESYTSPPKGQLSNYTQQHDGEFNVQASFSKPKRHTKYMSLDDFMEKSKKAKIHSNHLRHKVLEHSVGASTTMTDMTNMSDNSEVDDVPRMMNHTQLEKEYIKLKREYRSLMREYKKLLRASKKSKKTKENFMNLEDNDLNLSLNELVLLVLVGVFLIFSMNSVVQLSRKFIRK